jgi:5-methylcytosine-specific restriction protein A
MLKKRQRPWNTPKEKPSTGRTKEGNKFYHNKQVGWKHLRKEQLRKYPMCQTCFEEDRVIQAKVVDHIKPRRLFPELETNKNNLRSLCDPCHNTKSGAERTCYTQEQWHKKNEKFKWL